MTEVVTEPGVCSRCGKKIIVAVRIPKGWDDGDRKEVLYQAKQTVLCASCRIEVKTG